MSDIYVLIHGAWHTGDLLEPVADHLRATGHTCHCPTLAGNCPDDDRATTGLQDAAQSVVDYFEEHDLRDVRLVAHSYGGMVISKVADMIPDRIRRLVYHNAFVPADGECLNDLVPGFYVATFDPIAAANDGAVMLRHASGAVRLPLTRQGGILLRFRSRSADIPTVSVVNLLSAYKQKRTSSAAAPSRSRRARWSASSS